MPCFLPLTAFIISKYVTANLTFILVPSNVPTPLSHSRRLESMKPSVRMSPASPLSVLPLESLETGAASEKVQDYLW